MKRSPTRKLVLPELERSICARVKEARSKLGYSQREFAEQIGITRASLASYEQGRVALRLYVAYRLTRQFIINEKWLATGAGDWRGCFDLRHVPAVLDLQLSPLLPYGEAFSKHLSPIYEEVVAEADAPFRIVLSEFESRELLENLFGFAVAQWCKELPPRLALDLVRQLLEAGQRLFGLARGSGHVPVFTEQVWRDICPEYARVVESEGVEPEPLPAMNHEKNDLTSKSPQSTLPPVKTVIASWPELRDRLRELTTGRGSQASLARRFGVTPEACSAWLRGTYAPAADLALKLRVFVESGEAAKLLTNRDSKTDAAAKPTKSAAKSKPGKGKR